MNGMHQAGILSSAKHFPGHGDTAKDSHHDLPLIRSDQERLLDKELYHLTSSCTGYPRSWWPFKCSYWDKGIPSSSEKIIQEYLINRNQYKGLVFTDAMNMGGASEISKISSIDVAAFGGNDIILIPSDLKKAIKK